MFCVCLCDHHTNAYMHMKQFQNVQNMNIFDNGKDDAGGTKVHQH